jgi:PhzF family phenazine biosynthesis protein
MGIPLYQVDAFTRLPFRGNPAAVCLLDAPRGDDWLQDVAREMNLSETAFLVPANDGYDLRWFTPAVEVDLCGHATLASAHMLWETGRLETSAAARFQTRSGLLTATKQGDRIEMDFPRDDVVATPAPEGLLEALCATAVSVGRTRFDYLVEVASAAEVRALTPDFSLLAHVQARGIIVTSPSDLPDYDFVSRFFAPASGISEDPVTGSSHCALAPFWAKRLGKQELTAYQASARGGTLYLRIGRDRVIIGGQAIIVFKGELRDDSRQSG